MKLFEISARQDADEATALIEENCQQFIKEGAPVLYRGMRLEKDHVKKINSVLYSSDVRKNRIPSDSSIELHNMLDGFFYKQFGIKARSQTVFCTGNKHEASSYSSGLNGTSLIVPKGDFKFVWSTIIDDAYTDLDISWYENYKLVPYINKVAEELGLEEMDTKFPNRELRLKLVQKLLDDYGNDLYVFDRNLDRAALSNNEIMIDCEEYYILSNGLPNRSEEKPEYDVHKIIQGLQ